MVTYSNMFLYTFIILSICEIRTVFNVQTREKRFIVQPRGGTYKLVLGLAIPVKLGSKQSMGFSWNMQIQYSQATNVSQYLTYPPTYTGKRSTDYKSYEVVLKNDRAQFYELLEETLDSEGLHGRQCLLRTICENAMDSFAHEENGLYGQLIHIMLTPNYGKEDIDQELDPVYMEAKRAGEYGVECETLYTQCEFEYGLLSIISNLVESH
ncbi:unnamed protein product [Phyllotreta striolata]|uniref:Uncharacterized protein n=1 Tax=Phyllotreta striolata TaxID=444603 RepID=A0A9N9XJB6_PHYSR|nr:unnamed protein product [Phyllotreta striolata]